MGMFSPDENGWVDGAELARLHKRYANLAFAAKWLLLAIDHGAEKAPRMRDLADGVRAALVELDMWPPEKLCTQDKDRPIVEMTWVAPTCECGRRTWKLWYAPEGGLLIQCECTRTMRVNVEQRVERGP